MKDTDLISEVQFLLIEKQDPTAWSSGMWTADEVENYLNNSQQDLVTSSGLILKREVVPTTPNLLRQPLPESWIATYAIAWQDAATGSWYPLEKAESWELDSLIPAWRTTPGRPRFWTEADGQSLTIQIVPAPLGAGQLEVLFAGQPSTLGHGGAAIDIPDDFAPSLTWGTIFRMLQKTGRAQDPARAAIAEQLADLGVEAAKLILMGRP
jgi:hypothetical protein